MSKVLDSLKALVGVGKAAQFVHVERELALVLGVAQELVKEQRQALQLTRGSDWELVKGAVTYTALAAKKILDALQAAPPAAASGEPPAGPPSGDLAPNTEGDAEPAAVPAVSAGPVVDLVCAKLPRNRRIILARAPDAPRGPFVRVRVKDSEKFTVGMEVKARLIADDLYQLDGNAPRFSGKY